MVFTQLFSEGLQIIIGIDRHSCCCS